VRVVGLHSRQRDLVCPVGALDLHAVHLARAGPALRCAQHDRRPARPQVLAAAARRGLDLPDPVVRRPQCRLEVAEHLPGVVAGDEDRGPPLAGQVAGHLVVTGPAPHRRAVDLVPVEVQHGEDGAVAAGVEEGRDLPRARQRSGLGLPVADDAGDQQVGGVEGGAGGVHQRVAELAALVDAAGGLHADVTGDAAGCGELAEQLQHPLGVRAHRRVDLAVRALQVGAGHQRRPAVPGAGDVDARCPGALDQPVQLHVQRRQPRAGAPVAEQPRLHVTVLQRPAQQRVVPQVDLADRQVVGRCPPPQVQFQVVGGVVSRVAGERDRVLLQCHVRDLAASK